MALGDSIYTHFRLKVAIVRTDTSPFKKFLHRVSSCDLADDSNALRRLSMALDDASPHEWYVQTEDCGNTNFSNDCERRARAIAAAMAVRTHLI